MPAYLIRDFIQITICILVFTCSTVLAFHKKINCFIFDHKTYLKFEKVRKNIMNAIVVSHLYDPKRNRLEQYDYELVIDGQTYQIEWKTDDDYIKIYEGGKQLIDSSFIYDEKNILLTLKEIASRR